MNIVATIDPANVHHVMSKKFGNYPKGSKLCEILDVLGEGVFSTDSTLWQYHRKMAQSFMNHPRFQQCLMKKIWEKVDNGLIKVLDHVSKQGTEIDLKDLFERYAFDTICSIIMNYDPKYVSIDLPSSPPSKALDDIEEAILYRFCLPTFIWKFQRWLGVGTEKRHKEAWKILDDFIYKCISRKQDEGTWKRSPKGIDFEVDDVDLLDLYMNESDGVACKNNNQKFLRDTILNFFIAGRDTTSTALSWFFYLLTKNPRVLSKIKAELDVVTRQATANHDNDGKGRCKYNYLTRNFEEFSEKLVYLHAALCESLRLYPPVAFEAKASIEPDILPSGHQMDSGGQILFCLYAMGRMKSIWGDDCYEFKPERWISDRGNIKHEPSYKFLAFNAGPRTCVGKSMAFIQMKAVATAVIQNYHIQPVEECPIVPDISLILHMKHAFKVKVFAL